MSTDASQPEPRNRIPVGPTTGSVIPRILRAEGMSSVSSRPCLSPCYPPSQAIRPLLAPGLYSFLPGPGKLERRKAAHESALEGAIDSITPSLSRRRLSDSVQFVGHHFQGLLFQGDSFLNRRLASSELL